MQADFDRHRVAAGDATPAAVQPREYDVRGYQAIEAGARVEFWDCESHLFTAPACAAATQTQREALVDAYRAGNRDGEALGKTIAQGAMRRALGIT